MVCKPALPAKLVDWRLSRGVAAAGVHLWQRLYMLACMLPETAIGSLGLACAGRGRIGQVGQIGNCGADALGHLRAC
jgi:hypothetical protein